MTIPVPKDTADDMARLTKEEIEEMRSGIQSADEDGLRHVSVLKGELRAALDELEEHRAREGKGVTLSEEAVEKIRVALENERVGAMPNTYVRRLADEALALLPSKKEPTLLEAAKVLVADLEYLRCNHDQNPPLSFEALRSAIEREEGK